MTKERKFTKEAVAKDMKRNWKRYLLVLPLIMFYIVFAYLPMSGILMAFSDYKPKLGILGSLFKRFVGLKNFTDFFGSFYFWRLMKNIILLNGWSLLIGFPLTIILALLINDIGNKHFRKTVQTLSYLPSLRLQREAKHRLSHIFLHMSFLCRMARLHGTAPTFLSYSRMLREYLQQISRAYQKRSKTRYSLRL